jgi:glycosyltransferase involved in cell wall biosynthesis
MTGSTEPLAVDSAWRAEAERAQEQALPSGSVVVSCSAPLGGGGLGRHAKEIMAALERRGQPGSFVGEAGGETEIAVPAAGRSARALGVALMPLTRYSPAWRLWKASVAFDRQAAAILPPAEHLIGFNGTSLAQFRRARSGGRESVSLVSATAHLRRLVRRHAEAHSRYPLERSWATRVLARNVGEYQLADRIFASSRYVWESFAEEGIDSEVLAHFPLTPDPRYAPDPSAAAAAEDFEIAYVGGLTVDKGVPLLIDAVRRLPYPDLRLKLVGGWKTRAMRRFVGEAIAADARIEVCPGDPLPRLRSARLYVHAAYSDGFGYAAAEALACGLPLLVSEDTGMKDLLEEGENGIVLPTGDLDALAGAIEAVYRRETPLA